MPDPIDTPPAAGSLSGVRVVEIGDVQGEYCGMILAGLGAEVVRIEPEQGASTRGLGPFVDDDPHPEATSALPPVAPQVMQSFHIAGEQVAFGIAAALFYRRRSGKGQRLTCAVHEAVSKSTETDLMGWVVQRQPFYRQTGRHAGPVVNSTFTLAHTKDGRWLNVLSIGARDRNLLKPFLERYGMGDQAPAEQLPEETGTRGIPGTTAAASENVEIIQRLVRRFTFDELPWQDMQEAGLLCAPVRKP